MERKFRCIETYRKQGYGEKIEEGTIGISEDRRGVGYESIYVENNKVCDTNSITGGEKWQEITEPRIELKCVGFEEGQSIRVLDEGGAICHMDNPYESYTVENGIIIADGEMWPYATVMCAKGAWSIELLPQPTEEDKQIAELKETIEEAMQKIEEIEKARK